MMPYLTCALFTIERAAIRIDTTDLYLSIAGAATAESDAPGAFAVPAKDLLERVKMMPDAPVTMTYKEGRVVVQAKGTSRRYTLSGMPGDDLPPVAKPPAGAPVVAVDASTLAQLIKRMKFAISSDETRAHLNSALLEWNGDCLRLVGTDGHRLAKAEERVKGRAADLRLLLPKKAMELLLKLCDEAIGMEEGARSIRIIQSGPTAFFEWAGGTFGVKLVDAQFPPYDQVIPKNQPLSLLAPRAIFAEALRAVAIASGDGQSSGVKFTLGKGKLRLSAQNADKGEGEDEIDVDYDGRELTVGLNASYVLDVLSALDCEQVLMNLGGDLDPVRMTMPKSEAIEAVIMPMRI
jgi:DNA polymerase-3 subunit beta